MTIIIDKNNKKDLNEILETKIRQKRKNGKLKSHYAQLKRGIDGLEYQKEMRENEE